MIIEGYMIRVLEPTSYLIYCYNDYSETNNYNLTLAVTSIIY